MAYNRIGYCEIDDGDGNPVRLDGFDFKFSVDRKAGAIVNTAEVSIAGLNANDMMRYISYAAQWVEFNKHRPISIYAGYSDNGKEPVKLFTGYIWHGLPTMPPDIWLNLKARTLWDLAMTAISQSIIEPTLLPKVCEHAANWIGKKLVWMVKKKEANEKIIPQFQCTGSSADLIKQLEDLAKDLISVSYNDVTGCVEIVDKDFVNTNMERLYVTKDTGLIGLPQPSPTGVEFDMVLNPKIRRFQIVHLESLLIPSISGDYNVLCYTHSGHLRGGEWKTHVKARRLNVYVHGKDGSGQPKQG